MIHFILMLLGLAFGNHNTNNSCNNNDGQVTVQSDPGEGSNPGEGTGEEGGPVGGNTGQIPPPFTNP